MASSTGITLAAGGIVLADLAVNGWDPQTGLRVAVATVAAAFVGAGVDKAVPGLGTGLAVMLLVAAILHNGPRIVPKLFDSKG